MRRQGLQLECLGILTCEKAKDAGLISEAYAGNYFAVRTREFIGKKTKAYQRKDRILKEARQLSSDEAKVQWLREYAAAARLSESLGTQLALQIGLSESTDWMAGLQLKPLSIFCENGQRPPIMEAAQDDEDTLEQEHNRIPREPTGVLSAEPDHLNTNSFANKAVDGESQPMDELQEEEDNLEDDDIRCSIRAGLVASHDQDNFSDNDTEDSNESYVLRQLALHEMPDPHIEQGEQALSLPNEHGLGPAPEEDNIPDGQPQASSGSNPFDPVPEVPGQKPITDGSGTRAADNWRDPLWIAKNRETCKMNTGQAITGLYDFVKHHKLTKSAVSDLLAYIELLLPADHKMVSTHYSLSEFLKSSLYKSTNEDGIIIRDMCRNPKCDHIYKQYPGNQDDICPECEIERFSPNLGDQLWGARKLRLASFATCFRILLGRQDWCRAFSTFSAEKAVRLEGHPCSSRLIRHAVSRLRPGFKDLSAEDQERLTIQFLETGQVCKKEDLVGKPPTILLLLECGMDAFQPFRRREHSTTLHLFRVLNTNINFATQAAAYMLSCVIDGPSESRLLDSVLTMMFTEIRDLFPAEPSECETEIPWRAPKLKTKMWTFDETGQPKGLEDVGVFVYWTGTMADMPMRCKIYKRLSWSAYLGCGQCGLRGVHSEGMNLLGYCEPVQADLQSNGENETWNVRTVQAYSNGVVQGRGRSSIILSPDQMMQRDLHVERETYKILASNGKTKCQNQQAVEKIGLKIGCKGRPIPARLLSYYDAGVHMPYATYHMTYEGFNKSFLASVSTMLASLGEDRKRTMKQIIELRLTHVIPRSTSKCTIRNFLQHLGHMSMGEMQLMWEIAIPYILHDWKEMGIAEDFVLQGLLTRHAAIAFTRPPDANRYAECIRDGERAAFAANFLSENRCDGCYKGVTLSVKAHVLSAHLAQTCVDRGHPAYSHDMWLERGLQTEAIRDKVTSYPEGVIWNKTVETWGASAWQATLNEEGLTGHPQIPPAPSIDDIRIAGKRSLKNKRHVYRKKRKAGEMDDNLSMPATEDLYQPEWLNVEAPCHSIQISGYETVFTGKFEKITGRMPRLKMNTIASAIGFWMMKASSENRSYSWPKSMTVPTERLVGVYEEELLECNTAAIGSLFEYKLYLRASLYGEEPLNTAGYGAKRVKDDSWIMFQMYVHRTNRDAVWCVGKIQYLVECGMGNKDSVDRAVSYGLEEFKNKICRFAIVTAYSVQTFGYRVSSQFLTSSSNERSKGEMMFKALKDAKIFQNKTEMKEFLNRVCDGARLRVPSHRPISLEGQKSIAVCLDTDWRNRDRGQWIITPVANIMPSMTDTLNKSLVDKAKKSTDLKKIADVFGKSSRQWGYFVPSYNMSS